MAARLMLLLDGEKEREGERRDTHEERMGIERYQEGKSRRQSLLSPSVTGAGVTHVPCHCITCLH